MIGIKVKISGELFEFVDRPRSDDSSETPVEVEVQPEDYWKLLLNGIQTLELWMKNGIQIGNSEEGMWTK